MAISSRPGLGTTVTLRLPRAPQVRIEARPRGSAVGLGRVLLVDDEEDVRILMRRMLLKAGVKAVETAAGGEEALASLASGALPEAIILDQNMPGMTGVQVLDRVRELHPDLPVLISSGQPGIETWPEFRRPKVGVISKPFTLTEIQHKLEEFGQELGLL
jgi:CheY-like chemotaxis protein